MIVLTVVLVTAAVIDIRFQRIPNLLTYPTMVAALGYHFLINGVDGLLFSAGGLIVGIALFIVPYLMGGMGAGDTKLMGAVGAVLGIRGVVIASFSTAFIGGIYALVLLAVRYKYSKAFISRWATTLKTLIFTAQYISIPEAENERKPELCYGVAISIGTISYIVLDLFNFSFTI